MSKKSEEVVDGRLKILLYLKFGHEDSIREAIKNDVNTYNFEDECTILEGLIEIKSYQGQIDEVVKLLIEQKNKEIEIKEITDEELAEIEDELDIDLEVDVTNEFED